MDLARPYVGVLDFFHQCTLLKIPVCIISHKTKVPYLGPSYDLHLAASKWLQKTDLSHVPAFFEPTLKSKLERIRKENCTMFIDDLPELFNEKEFPENVTKVLFDPQVNSWSEINNLL